MTVAGGDAPGSAEVVAFWVEAGRRRWFQRDAGFDAQVRARFEPAYRRAVAGALDAWRETAEGALAMLLLLDQFPRNMFRDGPQAYAADPLAREVATGALIQAFDLAFPLPLQPFFYLPFAHDESASSQARALVLFEAFVARGGEASYLRSARSRAELIARFGRFPHRNLILSRAATPGEEAYLTKRGSSS